MTLRERRLLWLEKSIQEVHAKAERARLQKNAKWQRDRYARLKKERRAARIAKNKATKAERLRIRNEKRAAKAKIAAEKLAAKSKPGPILQAKLDAYQAGLACGWERGRQYERTNGKDAVTPETL
jgi:hypothetical protein